MNDHRLRRASVRWQDGSYDHTRTCILCNLETCLNPVYKDFYKEVSGPSYWNWMAQNNLKEDSNELDRESD